MIKSESVFNLKKLMTSWVVCCVLFNFGTFIDSIKFRPSAVFCISWKNEYCRIAQKWLPYHFFIRKQIANQIYGEIHTFFYKERFFSIRPQCCLTFSLIELQMLLRCCLRHRSIIILRHFIFTIFVPTSRPRSIYVVYMWSIFHFHLHFHND